MNIRTDAEWLEAEFIEESKFFRISERDIEVTHTARQDNGVFIN